MRAALLQRETQTIRISKCLLTGSKMLQQPSKMLELCSPAEWWWQQVRQFSTSGADLVDVETDVEAWQHLGDPKQAFLKEIEDIDDNEQIEEDGNSKVLVHEFLHFQAGTPLADAVARAWCYTAGKPLSIYIRSCYNVILDRIKEWVARYSEVRIVQPVGVVLLGSPGIGKTGFLIYLLWRTVVQNKENAIAKFKSKTLPYFAFKWLDGGSKLEVSGHLSLSSASRIFDSTPWYFCDSRVDDFHFSVKCVVACSPARKNYSEFAKRDDIKLLYDPVWTLKEIFTLNKQVFGFNPDTVTDRFAHWGGIPRYVLGIEDNYDILNQAIDQISNFQAVLHLVNSMTIQDVSHKLFHYAVNELCTGYRVTLASKYTSSRIYKTAQLGRSVELGERFAAIGKGNMSANYIATLFEEEFHSLIQEGGTFSVRKPDQKDSLGSSLHFTRLVNQTWLISGTGRKGAATEAVFPTAILDNPAYLRPVSGNNKAWDSIALYEKNGDTPARIFQVTMSDDKNKSRESFASGISRALQYLAQVHPGPVELFFVVPEYRFDEFSKDLGQAFDNVTFYVLLLDDGLTKRELIFNQLHM